MHYLKRFFHWTFASSQRFFLLTCVSVFLLTTDTNAQKANIIPLTRIEFLFDASQSMFAQWQSNTRYEVAKKLLGEMVDSLDKINNLELALRVYGHTKKFPPQDCDDTKLEVPFGKNTAYQIKKRLSEIGPSGTTPIAMSLDKCGGDFPSDPSRNIIILITDEPFLLKIIKLLFVSHQ